MLESDGAVETKFRSRVAEGRNGDRIVENVMQPAKFRRARLYVQSGTNEAEIIALAWAKHHTMLAQFDRFRVIVDRDMPHREEAHVQSGSAAHDDAHSKLIGW
jgi:hypothetical protein